MMDYIVEFDDIDPLEYILPEGFSKSIESLTEAEYNKNKSVKN